MAKRREYIVGTRKKHFKALPPLAIWNLYSPWAALRFAPFHQLSSNLPGIFPRRQFVIQLRAAWVFDMSVRRLVGKKINRHAYNLHSDLPD
jgi:hypothetical protein